MAAMSLGATHYRWRRDVKHLVERVRDRWPSVRINTYEGHPWPGWDGQSFDVWGPGGRGDPLPVALGEEIRRFLMRIPGRPYIRHTIWLHQLWTSFGGSSYWSSDDHSGRLRHLHVTYW